MTKITIDTDAPQVNYDTLDKLLSFELHNLTKQIADILYYRLSGLEDLISEKIDD